MFVRFLFVLIVSTIAARGAWADGSLCAQLFSEPKGVFKTSAVRFNQDSTLWRFDPAIGTTQTESLLHAKWQKKLNRSVHGFFHWKSLLSVKKETHRSLFFSKDQIHVVSISSQNKIRIYDSESERLVAEIENFFIEKSFDLPRLEVVTTSNSHFVLAVESSAQTQADQQLGLSRFFPKELFVFDYGGSLVKQVYLDQILKRVEISPDETEILIMEADQFYSRSLSGDEKLQANSNFHGSILNHFQFRDQFVYQTFHFAEESNFFLVAASSHRWQETHVFVLKKEHLFENPEWVQEYKLPLKKVLKLRIKDHSLLVTGLTAESEAPVELNVPL